MVEVKKMASFGSESHSDSEIKAALFNEIPSKKRMVEKFELMHEYDVIVIVDYTKEDVVICNEDKLPFNLRGRQLVRSDITEWLTKRLSTIHRTYMSKLYLLRKIGRDQNKVIADSSAISVIDNFWIRRPDTKQSWDEIQIIRDMNKDLIEVMLDGRINEELMRKAFHDMTSVFTVKGAFKKLPYAGKILKKDFNAENEIVGFELGRALGISVAEATDIGDGIVACTLFTSTNTSMSHVADILDFTEYNKHGNRYKAIYDFFASRGRADLVKGLERLYILAYVTLNFDLHEENFGILYNPKNFYFQAIAPAYDFNDAFQAWEGIDLFDEWIMANLSEFLKKNVDILDGVSNAIKVIETTGYLTEEVKNCVIARLNHIKNLK